MKTTTGYSLWLMPSGKVRDFLFDKIKKISREYFTPIFEPHVTLLGEIILSEQEVMAKSTAMASGIHPFSIRFGSIDGHTDYFRSLFARVEESPEILHANQAARGIFNRQKDPLYMPHISLLYGMISQDFKEDIIDQIGKSFNLSFDVTSIHIVATIGEVSDWKKIAEIPLSPVSDNS
jgi:2'-5' RNA ligase